MTEGFVKDSASYRRVGVYIKSFVRYKRERERRRRVRLQAAKGFTQEQIARELGVSTRTVKRDWDKVRSYAKVEMKRKLRREFEERYPGLGFDEALERLKRDVKEYDERARVPQPLPVVFERGLAKRYQQMIITLNLDNPTPEGFPTLAISPDQNLRYVGDLELRVVACKNGERREMCSFHFYWNSKSRFR